MVPFRVPGERGAFFSVARRKDGAFTYAEATVTQLIGGIAFQRGRELIDGRAVKALGAPLSPRQMDCLRLIAAGKTAWELGLILKHPSRPVQAYVECPRSRYCVKTLNQHV